MRESKTRLHERSKLEELLSERAKRRREESRIKSTSVGPWSRNLRKVSPLLILFILVTGGVWWFTADHTSKLQQGQQGASSRAVLVDELSASFSDPSFIQNATTALVRAGYSVDYVAPKDVTVRYFEELPSKGYGVIVIRAHSGADTIYTSEPYSETSYVLDQIANYLDHVQVYGGDYFAITPQFVLARMHGSFPGSIVIEMGCGGLFNTNMAEAFLARGARAFVGWDGTVTGSHTDASTSIVLDQLTHGGSVRGAVDVAMTRLGPDPMDGGRLGYYDATVPVHNQLAELMGRLEMALSIFGIAAAGPTLIFIFLRRMWRI